MIPKRNLGKWIVPKPDSDNPEIILFKQTQKFFACLGLGPCHHSRTIQNIDPKLQMPWLNSIFIFQLYPQHAIALLEKMFRELNAGHLQEAIVLLPTPLYGEDSICRCFNKTSAFQPNAICFIWNTMTIPKPPKAFRSSRNKDSEFEDDDIYDDIFSEEMMTLILIYYGRHLRDFKLVFNDYGSIFLDL